jgi:hypothetical protein
MGVERRERREVEAVWTERRKQNRQKCPYPEVQGSQGLYAR